MRISIEEFRKKYPHLAREILDNEPAEYSDLELVFEKLPPDPWRGYTPTVTDYIRRCKTLDEAFEVIDYLEKHGELTHEDAEEYRRLLREYGLEYFGSRKEENYYYRKAVEYWYLLNKLSRRRNR